MLTRKDKTHARLYEGFLEIAKKHTPKELVNMGFKPVKRFKAEDWQTAFNFLMELSSDAARNQDLEVAAAYLDVHPDQDPNYKDKKPGELFCIYLKNKRIK